MQKNNRRAPTTSNMRYFKIHLEDQAPAIGSGLRWVLALEGRRWVQIISPTLQTARISVSEWLRLNPEEIEMTAEVRRALRRTMHEWRRYRPRTAMVKRAEQSVRKPA